MGFTAINALENAAVSAQTQQPCGEAPSNVSSKNRQTAVTEYNLGCGENEPVVLATEKTSKRSRKLRTTAAGASTAKRRRTSNVKDTLPVTKIGSKNSNAMHPSVAKQPQKSKRSNPKETMANEMGVSSDIVGENIIVSGSNSVGKSVPVFAPVTSMDVLGSTFAQVPFDSVKANGGQGFTVYQNSCPTESGQSCVEFSQPWLTVAPPLIGIGAKHTPSDPNDIRNGDGTTDSYTLESAVEEQGSVVVPNSDRLLSEGKLEKLQGWMTERVLEAFDNLPDQSEDSPPQTELSVYSHGGIADPRVSRAEKQSVNVNVSESRSVIQPKGTSSFDRAEVDELVNVARYVEGAADHRPAMPPPRRRKQNMREVYEHENYGGLLLSDADRLWLMKESRPEGGLKPIVRKPFAPAILDRSPISGASKSSLLRTCFRVGEALNTGSRAIRSGENILIELYARVTSSWREGKTGGKQHFVFKDLYHDNQPHLQGSFELCSQAQLWDLDSKVFLKTDRSGIMCRTIAKMKRENQRLTLHILSIWKASWEDVNHVAGIYAKT